jgi:glutathione peroxidase
MSSAYDFPETRACRGTVSIIVNVASHTHIHYKQLSAMCKKIGPAGFNVIAFPVNQFGGQEPEPIHQIHSFARGYGATLPFFRMNDEKVNVKGANAHPLFKWLVEQTGQECTWNFCKYLISPDGQVVK